ncbi:MAG: hypothetical protein KC546_10430 [Anaerolineae bacterium]|nr:hypothetical protein [Anaerolineae bacterium]MCA9888781.1 hypothetical protein [Anaerolineae bacterium]MCA9893222.1 hypothetical protein [Anaerolineae bacterium]
MSSTHHRKFDGSKTGKMPPLDETKPPTPQESQLRRTQSLPHMPFDPSRTGIMPLITEFPDDDVRDRDTPDAPDGQ